RISSRAWTRRRQPARPSPRRDAPPRRRRSIRRSTARPRRWCAPTTPSPIARCASASSRWRRRWRISAKPTEPSFPRVLQGGITIMFDGKDLLNKMFDGGGKPAWDKPAWDKGDAGYDKKGYGKPDAGKPDYDD